MDGLIEHVYIADKFSAENIRYTIPTKIFHSSPGRAGYGLSFIRDAYIASAVVVPYANSCYVGPRYNGTRLYNISQ